MADGSIRFFTDLSTAGFESGAKRLQSISASASASVQSAFGSAAASIARLAAPILTVYTAINSVRNALNLTDRLSELSKSTGEAAGNLAVLERAFQNTGIGAEKVGPMFAKMSSFIADLAAGVPKATQTSEALGVSLEQLKGKTPTQQFQVLLQAVAGVADENLRAASAGDIFGDKMGYKLVPFAREFNTEMTNASAELGSTVRLLNENATGIENMADKFGAISGKLTEFTIGLASGTTGANDLVEALSKIDAAGLGERLGEALRMAFAAPMETVKAIGYTLETGAKVAGNALINAVTYAGEVFQKTINSENYIEGLGLRMRGTLEVAAFGFLRIIQEGAEKLYQAIAKLPGPLGEAARKDLVEIAKWQESLNKRLLEAQGKLEKGAELIKGSISDSVQGTEILQKDWLGVSESAEKAAYHIDQAAKISSPQISKEAAKTEEHFKTGSTALAKVLAELRGFNLSGGPPLPMPGAVPPPKGGPLAPPGGGGGLPPAPPPSGGGGGGGGGGMFGPATTAGAATMASLSSNVTFQGRPANNFGEAWQGTINNNFGGSKMSALQWLRNTPTYNPKTSEEQNMANALRAGALPPNTPPGGGGGGGGGAAGAGSGGAGGAGGAGAGGPGGGGGGPGGGNPPGGPGGPQPNFLQEIVTDIYNLLDERLPIQALV